MAYDYDVLVLGAGAAGLTAAGVSANFGAKALLVERDRLGGDCTWYGCVPSKTLIKSARVAHHIRTASHYGLMDQPVQLDFGRVMAHVRATREEVYEDADKPEIYEAMGVTVQQGSTRFVDDHTIEIGHDGRTDQVSGRYVMIATGSQAVVPPIDGLGRTPYLTNETLFEIEKQPSHLVIIGGGPIGTEMAQAFVRLGTEVTVIDQGDRILKKDDPELANMLQAVLTDEGVGYLMHAQVRRVAKSGTGVNVEVEADGKHRTVSADALLVATGRRPNVETLNLEAAGVDFTEKGITVNDRCRTNRTHIYALGDVTGRYQFTHMSEHMAKVAVANALLKVPMKIDGAHLPWVTYADPELAHVGATERQLNSTGTSYRTYRFPYAKLDRAITEHETTGLIKVHARPWNGKILGVSILGARAGDLIGEYALAMRNGITLRRIADTIHPYPTYGLGVRRAADQWYVQSQQPWLIRLLQKVFGYRGPVIEPDPDRIV